MNKANQSAIRASLKNALFNTDKKNKKSKQRQNSSPPIQNNSPRTMVMQFRHFSDVYECTNQYIGEGAHGIVMLCTKRGLQQSPIYAVKIFRTGDPEIINTIRQTFQINRSLNDLSCVVKALDLFINSRKEEHHLVMEYCPFQSLEKKLQKQQQRIEQLKKHIKDLKPHEYELDLHFQSEKIKYDEHKIQTLILNLAQAVRQLHSRGICHRDIKPDNILIGEQQTIKLVDFGVSKRFVVKGKYPSKIDMWTRTGSLFYQSPEIFQGGGYDEKVDIWSIGIILFQLLVGTLPFYSESVLDTIEMITYMQLKTIPSFQKLKPLEKDILKRLLKKDPKKRLSAEDITSHPWLLSVQPNKSTKSFDDADIIDQKEDLNLMKSIQLQFQRYGVRNRQTQGMNTIIEESAQNSLKNSWNYWDDHVYQVQQDAGIIMNYNDDFTPKIGTSQEIQEQQAPSHQNDDSDFTIGLVRTSSVQFDQL